LQILEGQNAWDGALLQPLKVSSVIGVKSMLQGWRTVFLEIIMIVRYD
jgi:hypothetical protein